MVLPNSKIERTLYLNKSSHVVNIVDKILNSLKIFMDPTITVELTKITYFGTKAMNWLL